MGKYIVTKVDEAQANIQRIHEDIIGQLERTHTVILTWSDAKALKEFLDDFAYS